MRSCVVTGSASGMGKAAADRLSGLGWRVIGVDIVNAEVTADLSTPAGRQAMVDQVTSLNGDTLDGAVACAGLLRPDPVTISVNYFGARATMSGLRPLLARGQNPRAVVVTSLSATFDTDDSIVAACVANDEAAAHLAAKGKDTTTMYTASKRALVLWCRQQAITADWAGQGILLNMVAPGIIDTPMMSAQLRDPAILEQMLRVSPRPLGRYGESEEVAALIAFLLSPENSMILGQQIFIDSGSEASLRPTHV